MATSKDSGPFLMKTSNNDLSCKNTENPDVAFQRSRPALYIDLFFRKPNKYGLSIKGLNPALYEKWTNHIDLLLARSGTKAARALHLLVFGPEKVARLLQTPSI